MSITKEFSSKLHKANDSLAKKTIINSWVGKFKSIVENTDKYGPDLIAEDNKGLKFFIEVEIKHNWNIDKFPFDSLHIPKRKQKFLKYGRIIFIVISKNLKWGLIVKGTDLKDTLLQEVENKYISGGEEFYRVPMNLCKRIIL